MNVLHIVQRYYPYVGGSELYFQEISERLAREGNTVLVYTTDAWDLEHFWSSGKRRVEVRAESHNGVEVRRFPVERLPASPLTYPVLRRMMAELGRLPVNMTPLLFALSRWTPRVPALDRALDNLADPVDIVHAANISLDATVYAAFRFARRRSVPLIITPFTHLGEKDDRRIRKQYTMPHQIELLKQADAVIVQTRLEQEALSQLGVPGKKMICIGVGVNPQDVLGGDGQRFRNKYGITGPIVFFVGTAAFDKGTTHVVEAMEKLWNSRDRQAPEPTLVIAGPQLTHFKNWYGSRSRETRARTHLLGFIPDQDKRDLYAAGDILVVPSRTDSFGIVYLEAWLYNKPVVGARAGGVPAVIADGRDGFLVRFGDAGELAARIKQLLAQPELASKFGQAGCAKVLGDYTWDKKYAQLRPVYQELAAR